MVVSPPAIHPRICLRSWFSEVRSLTFVSIDRCFSIGAVISSGPSEVSLHCESCSSRSSSVKGAFTYILSGCPPDLLKSYLLLFACALEYSAGCRFLVFFCNTGKFFCEKVCYLFRLCYYFIICLDYRGGFWAVLAFYFIYFSPYFTTLSIAVHRRYKRLP